MEKNRKLPGKVGPMLSSLVLLSVLYSCSKGDLQEPPSSSGSPSETLSESSEIGNVSALSANILYNESFEGSAAFATYGINKQIETSYGLTLASSPVFEGSKSGRFELRDTDPMNNNGTRAEVSFPTQSNLNRWYSFSVYFPSADYKYDDADELINQWHQGGGVTPSITLGTKLDRYRFIVKETPTTKQTYDLGSIAKDKWNTFVFHIKHSSKTDGLIELWINGQKVVSRTGINMYDLSSGQFYSPKWKLGVYKSAWNGTNTTLTNKRVLFYDNVRIGSESATLADMASGASTSTPTTTTPTTSSSITSFSLINAATEQAVMTITNGATISLSKYGSKLNIRANSATSLGSVKLELGGKQIKTYTDSKIPYALHGDDTFGNYYYGNWNPPALGTYTLKATPYSGSSASGTAGAANSISFTFTN
jgi:hypothetical protein